MEPARANAHTEIPCLGWLPDWLAGPARLTGPAGYPEGPHGLSSSRFGLVETTVTHLKRSEMFAAPVHSSMTSDFRIPCSKVDTP